MSRSINSIRVFTALAIIGVLPVVGVLAAVTAFALLELPNGKPAAAAPRYPAYSVEVDTVGPTTLSVSQTEVRPNESVIIQGSGFGNTPGNALSSAQIGDVALLLISDGGNLADVAVSDSGQFAATFAIWPANPADDNPTLDGGTLEIKITDAAGFSAAAQVTLLPLTLTITPDVAGPLHNVHIAGANWPAANPDGGAVSPVNIHIDDGVDACGTQKATDANGKWYVRYHVPDNISLPATLNVIATYGSEISQSASFKVMDANLKVTPSPVEVGEKLTLYAAGFARYANNITVKIGPSRLVTTRVVIDVTGNAKDLIVTVTVPALDAGRTYTVQLQADGDGDDGGAVAIGAVTVGP